MRKFLIKTLLIFLALGGSFIWLGSDASVLAGSTALGLDDEKGYLVTAVQDPVPLDLLEAAHASMVRVSLPFQEVVQAPGVFVWEYQSNAGYVNYHLLFERLTHRGIKPVVVLTGGPSFANHLYPQQPVHREVLLLYWENFVRAAVQQFGDHVHYWQIGSTVNDPDDWGRVLFPGAETPIAPPDPALYSDMLKIAHHVIKSENTTDTILLGGLALGGDCAFYPIPYLQVLADQDAWYAFDIVQVELPILNGPPESATVDTCGFAPTLPSGIPSADALSAVREWIQDTGKKPVWVHGLAFSDEVLTEQALERGTLPEVVASDYLARASGILLAYGSAERVFWRFNPPSSQPGTFALQSLANLNGSLAGTVEYTRQSENSPHILRFRGNGGLSLLAWRESGGEIAQAAILPDVDGFKLHAFSTDAPSLKNKDGVALQVDAGGDTALLIGERPVIVRGRPAGLKQMLSLLVKDSAAQAGKGVKAKLASWLSAQKAKAVEKVGIWVEEQQKSLLDILRDSFNQWLRKSLGLAKG